MRPWGRDPSCGGADIEANGGSSRASVPSPRHSPQELPPNVPIQEPQGEPSPQPRSTGHGPRRRRHHRRFRRDLQRLDRQRGQHLHGRHAEHDQHQGAGGDPHRHEHAPRRRRPQGRGRHQEHGHAGRPVHARQGHGRRQRQRPTRCPTKLNLVINDCGTDLDCTTGGANSSSYTRQLAGMGTGIPLGTFAGSEEPPLRVHPRPSTRAPTTTTSAQVPTVQFVWNTTS